MPPRREITIAQAISWTFSLAGGTAAVAWAFLLFFADREQRAAAFCLGGSALILWAATRLTDRQHQNR